MELGIDFSTPNKNFDEIGAIVLTNLLSKELCQSELEKLFLECARGNLETDPMCKSPSTMKKRFGLHDNLLPLVQPTLEKLLGIELYPCYTYSRLYMSGDKLHIHTDRIACEISLTINLGWQGNSPWPIWFLDTKNTNQYCKYEYGKKQPRNYELDPRGYYPGHNFTDDYDISSFPFEQAQSVNLNVGDALLYKGCEVYHWRNNFEEAVWQGQVFLHYVDANGLYNIEKYNGREKLGVK